MLAPPDPEGTLSAVLILPGAGVERGKGKKKTETWDEIRTEDDVAALFRDVFPDAFGVDGEDGTPAAPPRETIRDVLRQRARPGGITTTCSRLVAHGGSVALVGDAAHSVWPSLGQGANAALETSMYLGAAIESKPDDLAGAMRYFDEVRGPQVRAVGRLSESGFGGKNRRWNAAFFAKLAALSLLHRVCPLLFDTPALTRINDPAWGYDDVEEETRAETGTLFAVATAVAGAAAGARWFGVRRGGGGGRRGGSRHRRGRQPRRGGRRRRARHRRGDHRGVQGGDASSETAKGKKRERHRRHGCPVRRREKKRRRERRRRDEANAGDRSSDDHETRRGVAREAL